MMSDIHKQEKVLELHFRNFLELHLARAMGPLAVVLIEDEMRAMDEISSRFPRRRASDLIRFVAREIPRKQNRVAFLKRMTRKIQELIPQGYE